MEYTEQIPFFLEEFLGKPASALPKGSQWVLVFEGGDGYNDPIPVDAILNTIKYEPRQWSVKQSMETVLGDNYQTKKGCLFAQAVQIPGENNIANPEGLQQGGFIRSYIGQGRDAPEPLKITFLETNTSFVDNVIRPWIITTAHLGLIARSGSKNYRCNISVYKLGLITPQQTPFVLQKYTFYGACPINIAGEEYNYSQTNTPINREATFIYHYYSLDSTTSNRANLENGSTLPLQNSTKERGVNTTTTGAIIVD
jgi:hypothetical protein